MTTDHQDEADLATLAQGYLRLTRCPGGRLTVRGLVCAHCGHDYTSDDRCGDLENQEQPK